MVEPPRRVLLVSHVGEMSGAEHSLLLLAAGLDPARWQATVAVPVGDPRLGRALGALPCVEVAGVPGLGPLGRSIDAPTRWLRGSRALRALARELRPGLIHANTDMAMAFAAPCSAIAPVIWHIRDMRRLGRLGRYLLRCSAARIAVSSAAARRYGLTPGPLDRVIANGVDLTRFRPPEDRAAAKRALGFAPDAPVALSIGQDCAWKRHDDFLALDAPGVQRVLVRYPAPGSRAGRPTSSHPSDVLVLPYRDRIEDLYAAADLYVHPAVGEAFGRTVLEALACGLPVVCRDDGGPAELVEHGVSGLVVPSAEGLGEAVRQLAGSADLTARMGLAARGRAERFPAARYVSEVEALYEHLLRSGGVMRGAPADRD